MKKIFVIILLISSCQEESLVKTYYSNGNIKEEYEVNEKGEKEGEYILYSQNGQIEVEAIYKSGLAEGLSYFYYPNGKIELISTYKNGMLNGLQKLYDGTGNIEMIQSYKDDTLLIDKRYHTNSRLWYIMSKMAFKDENQSNSVVEFDENGRQTNASKYAEWNISGNHLEIYLQKGFMKDSVLVEVVNDYQSLRKIREIMFKSQTKLNIQLQSSDYINNRLNLVIHDYQKEETTEVDGVNTRLLGYWNKYYIQIDKGEIPTKYNMDYISY